ncbi:MAG: glycerol-3-phosphate dehydrogenase [Hyphomicrobiales bacterium]|nr:MAG: glycerol-3-phosphate dehydrogenase [Hyphomicrobiales bacterium]
MSNDDPYNTVGVIGAGAWGTALALTAARAGRDVTLAGRDAETLAAIEKGENPAYLPGIRLDTTFRTSNDANDAARAAIVLLVTPAQTTRTVLEEIAETLAPGTPLVLCAKGIEAGTGRLLTEIVEEVVPQAIPCVLSGPSFAADVARGLPTAVTIAAPMESIADRLAAALSGGAFRPYASADVTGAQIGGALKNVLAIACGAVSGRKLGASAQAALTARGFAEMTRLGRVLGARPETLTGLSGLGDLVLTCSTPQSRNFAFGMALGEGKPLETLTGPGAKLAEGVHTAAIAVRLAHDHGIDLPISEAVDDVVAGRLTIAGAIDRLMQRPLKREDW